MDPRRYFLHRPGWNNSSALGGYDPLIASNLRRGAVLGARGYIESAFQQEALLGRVHPSGILFERDERDQLPIHYPALGLLAPAKRLTLEEEVAIIREAQRRELDKQFALLERERESQRHEQEKQFALLESDREKVLEREFENFRRHYTYNRESSEDDEDDYEHPHCVSGKSRERSQNADYKFSTRCDSDSDQDRGGPEKDWSPRRGRGQIRSRRSEREWSSDRERRHERSHAFSDNDRGQRSLSPLDPNKGHKESHEETSHDPSSEKNDREGTRYPQRPVLPPSSTLVVKGLSKETLEDNLYQALSEWGPVKDIRVIKDKISGTSRGFAFIEFPSVEGAQKMVEDIGIDGLLVNGRRLFFEYSSKRTGVAVSQTGQGSNTTRGMSSVGSKSGVAPTIDWMCITCGCVNFARRTFCFQCNEGRVEDILTGDVTLSAPPSGANKSSEPGRTNVLVVRGLDENVEEEILRFEFSKHAPIKDLRLIRDKLSQVSRGFAFVHFHSVEDASKALEASNGLKLEKNGQLLKVAFAKSSSIIGPSQGNSLATAAIEAATFAQQYNSVGWAPKEYQPEDGASTKKGEMSNSSREISQLIGSNQQNITGSEANTTAHSGFVWDEASGYYYDAASGFYYDGHRGLYYDGNNGIWYSYNQETQQYVPYAKSRTASEANTKIENGTLKPEKGNRGLAIEKVTVQSKAVISAPACTITLENDLNEKKSKLAESVAAAVSSARAAAKNEKEKMKEKQKEMRLAGKNPGMGSKKSANVVTPWKLRKSEDPGSWSRVENTSTATTSSIDIKLDKSVSVGEGVSRLTVTRSNDVLSSGNISGGCHQLSEMCGRIEESGVSKTIKGVIRESNRGTTKSIDTPVSSVVSEPTSSSSIFNGITKRSEITGETKQSGINNTIMGVIRESGRISKRSVDTAAVLRSSTISQPTTSPSVFNSPSKLSEISEGSKESGISKSITGVIREFAKGTKSVDTRAVLGSSMVSPQTTSTSLVPTATKIPKVSGRIIELGIGNTITGVIRESSRCRTGNLGSGEISLSTISQPSMSTAFKTPASALLSHGSTAGTKRKFSEAPQPVLKKKAAEASNPHGSLQPFVQKYSSDFMGKDVELGATYGLDMQYPQSFGGHPVQTFNGLANLERESFVAINCENAFNERIGGHHMLRNLGCQEGSVLGSGMHPFQQEKMGERVAFW